MTDKELSVLLKKCYECIHKNDIYTCGATVCSLKERLPCLVCSISKYRGSEWSKKAIEEFQLLYPLKKCLKFEEEILFLRRCRRAEGLWRWKGKMSRKVYCAYEGERDEKI